jgi:hypothetical protein
MSPWSGLKFQSGRTIAFICASLVLILILLLTYNTSLTGPFPAIEKINLGGHKAAETELSPLSSCTHGSKGSTELWEAAKSKYQFLVEDKFT